MMTRGGRHSAGTHTWTRRLAAVLAATACCVSRAQESIGETIVFGGDLAYPPFEWLTASGPAGFDIDLDDVIATTGGAKPIDRITNWRG
jgi:ABC-type amino acid transport substrate-binding protein